jgi:uncharacterized small protein (DUF1192 family)
MCPGTMAGQGGSMLDDEELSPAKKHRLDLFPLDPLSVADLRDYISQLQAEIARTEAAIAKKQGARGHADSFFKIP